MSQVVHVQTTGSYVRSDKQLQVADTEFLHYSIALRLRKFTVQWIGVITLLHQFVCNLLSFLTCAAEDDTVDLRIIVNDAFQRFVFIFGVHRIGNVLYVTGAFVFTTNRDFFCVLQVILWDTRDFRAHRCREKQCVTLLRNIGKNSVDTFRKSHVQHLVRFVHHNVADSR